MNHWTGLIIPFIGSIEQKIDNEWMLLTEQETINLRKIQSTGREGRNDEPGEGTLLGLEIVRLMSKGTKLQGKKNRQRSEEKRQSRDVKGQC